MHTSTFDRFSLQVSFCTPLATFDFELSFTRRNLAIYNVVRPGNSWIHARVTYLWVICNIKHLPNLTQTGKWSPSGGQEAAHHHRVILFYSFPVPFYSFNCFSRLLHYILLCCFYFFPLFCSLPPHSFFIVLLMFHLYSPNILHLTSGLSFLFGAVASSLNMSTASRE